MKPTRLKVPRASVGVTVADDPDYIALVQTPEGREAFALFIALIVQAKVQRNGGRFSESETVVACMVRWPAAAFAGALRTLTTAPGRWVVREGAAVVIRSFDKWNDTRGGQRPGAGRKAAGESKRIQSESMRNQKGIEAESISGASVSVSVSGSPAGDHGAGEAPAPRKRRSTKQAERDAIFDTIVREWDPTLSGKRLPKADAARIGSIADLFRARDATPESIVARRAAYRKAYPGLSDSARAVAQHWDDRLVVAQLSGGRNGRRQADDDSWSHLAEIQR